MDLLDPHTVSLIGLTGLLLVGGQGWLSVLLRLPSGTEAPVERDFPPLPIPHSFASDPPVDTVAEEQQDGFHSEGVEAWKLSISGDNISGQFYEIKERSDGLVTFYFGAVSGRGLPASLYGVSCSALLRQASNISVDPVGVVTEVNQTLAERNGDGRYATILYGTLDPSSGRLRVLSAGHQNPLRLTPQGEVKALPCAPCLPMGMEPRHNYALSEYYLAPGETLLLYSQGVVKARNRQREAFGIASLKAVLEQAPVLSPRRLVQRVSHAVSLFSSGQRAEISLVALRYTGVLTGFETNKLQCSVQ